MLRYLPPLSRTPRQAEGHSLTELAQAGYERESTQHDQAGAPCNLVPGKPAGPLCQRST